jgi:hypothetical protein
VVASQRTGWLKTLGTDWRRPRSAPGASKEEKKKKKKIFKEKKTGRRKTALSWRKNFAGDSTGP